MFREHKSAAYVRHKLSAAYNSDPYVGVSDVSDCSPFFTLVCVFLRNADFLQNTPRVKRSAYWFLGEYCCQLTGSPAHADQAVSSPQSAGQSPSSKPKPGSGSDDLLEVWGSSAPSRSEGGAARPAAAAAAAGFNGLEAGARAVAHPVVSAMNGATVSIMMRLKHAAMFEDFQVRACRDGC